MKRQTKKQVTDLLISLTEAVQVLKTGIGEELQSQMLLDCIQASIAITNVLCREPQIGEAAARHLKECQAIAEQLLTKSDQIELERLEQAVSAVCQMAAEIPVTYLVVFLPYKAEMWDSMASVWEACQKDERCECVVMPIPYYTWDTVAYKWELCYDGGKFPNEIPIVSYQDYPLNRHRPDVAYIHNPFDDHNRVTSVHPSFYSHELKKNTDILVYIPYYVTSGYFSSAYRDLPVNRHADYLIWQSEHVKNCCRGTYFYDKILPFGSPKLDHVIRTCQNGSRMPAEWQSLLEGKRVLMLNTSINSFLSYGNEMFKKLRRLFRLMQVKKQAALIWRPHPLLEATIQSMRPELSGEFSSLKTTFIDSRIGVFDQTADIADTVALSDGYIGEAESSVKNLFAAAGKPVFILNFHISAPYNATEKRTVYFSDLVMDGTRAWITAHDFNALLSLQIKDKKIRLIDRMTESSKWRSAYSHLAFHDGKLYLSPDFACCPVEYDPGKETCTALITEHADALLRRGNVVAYQGKVFFLPKQNGSILEWNISAQKWKTHDACIQKLCGKINRKLPETFDCQADGSDLWAATPYNNCVLQFGMDSGLYTIHHIGEPHNRYSGLVVDPEYLWLAELGSGAVLRWHRLSGSVTIFAMPAEFCTWENYAGDKIAHQKLVDLDEWIITVPAHASGMVKIHKETGKTSMLLQDFWSGADKAANGYLPNVNYTASITARLDGERILVQRSYDAAAAVVHVSKEDCQCFTPMLSAEDFSRFTDHEDGFEQISREAVFMKYESRLFSLEDYLDHFMTGLTADLRERQLKANESMASNLDGSCGEKIHSYLMETLETKHPRA